ncbi:hypothetical protein Arub01_42460 [Actinomadura rubrobrunea]|uniref:YdbS-like PH domain-containing protein n=1 Tax=Actinomadura rubrobrunea TaxID=115335 RepID=A0A9W6UY89_9ACTN|nr:PH domain-containing protein [Actinomadura rubrobrunea]GLW66002.1 hypothetical protein Arub01_42460 [Actinomadura rubrobrunea]
MQPPPPQGGMPSSAPPHAVPQNSVPQNGVPQNGVPQNGVPQYPADQAFQPGGGLSWSPISKRYTWHRRIAATLWAVPITVLGAYLVARGGGALGAALWGAAALISLGLAWIVADLAYRSWGYAERGDDLLVTHGVFVKRLVVVPYGRMQVVDVTAGLLEQWMGIATVRLHTAAAATDAVIPGLPAAEAALLRDRLARKGEERSMGL